MRALGVAVLLILTLLVPRPAAAPPGTQTHLQPFTATVGPTQAVTLPPLSLDGAPLQAGWVFLLQAKSTGNLTARLSLNGSVAKVWDIPRSTSWLGTTVVPDSGYYNLTLSNPGASGVTFSVYYDMSCECIGKMFPIASGQLVIPSGYVLFDTQAPGRSTIVTEFSKPSALSLKITAATLAQPGGAWPADFTVVGETDTPFRQRAAPDLPYVWLYDVNVTVAQAVRIYYFVQAVSFDALNGSSEVSRTVSFNPQITAAPPDYTVPLVLGGVAVALAGVGGILLWRNRRPSAEVPPGKKGSKGKGAKKASAPKKGARPRDGGRGGARTRRPPARKRRT